MKNRLCALVLAAALLVCAAGCGDNTGIKEEEKPVLLTVGDRGVGYEEAQYFLYSSAHMVGTYYPYVGWDDMIENVTKTEFIKNSAIESMKLYYAINRKATELGCGLTDEQRAEFEAARQQEIEQYGGEEAFLEQLKLAGISEELYVYFNETSMLYANLRESLYGEEGSSLPTPEQLNAYIEEGNYICVTHVLLSFRGSTGESLPDEELEQKRELAVEIQARAASGEDFFALVEEYGEDPGVMYEPHYYNMSPGQMVAEFEDAAYALEENEVSGIVETAYGLHIIKRIPVETESFINEYCNEAFAKMAQEWGDAIPHTTNQEFENIDVKELYENLNANLN